MFVSFKWLLYINPNYYGYAGMLRELLPTLQTGCDFDSTIECYPDTGEYWIEDFGLHDVQPHLFLAVRRSYRPCSPACLCPRAFACICVYRCAFVHAVFCSVLVFLTDMMRFAFRFCWLWRWLRFSLLGSPSRCTTRILV